MGWDQKLHKGVGRSLMVVGLGSGVAFLLVAMAHRSLQSSSGAAKSAPAAITPAPAAIAPAPTVASPAPSPESLDLSVHAGFFMPPERSQAAPPQKSAAPAATPRPQAPARHATPPPATAPVLTVDSAIEMQVAIREDAPSLTLGTSKAGKVLSMEGKVLQTLAPQQAYRAEADGKNLVLNNQSLPTAVWIQPDRDGFIYVDDRFYRGRVLLLTNGNQLLAVNHVLLRDYLYSVVGSEVPASWPMETLKAQAIAARSYALTYYFRPATSLYHLGDTESYQVYGGVEKETDTTRSAVNATGGEFISYKGGIVESLYAASDEIVATAHGGRGMSQTGAKNLAEKGLNYLQILNSYYPGTSVARIVMDHH
ncbi:MAG: SpoIID/LytB domain-containing protein [Leptolyngbyaceae cyanobacterium bins.59]|nr:SpoIID/LytB domain-containing protein [Leptolyngbyaceae cyanobacterium bins.59]